MNLQNSSNQPITKRSKMLPVYGAISFAVLIAIVGAAMMTLTSSPQMKGAALLWLPAALQLVAGVWFGPRLGLLSGGLGAYAAGIIAYGGWGLVDIILNPVAGGLANSWLPAILFRLFKINPTFDASPKDIGKAIYSIVALIVMVFGIGLLPILIESVGSWAYIVAILLLVIGSPILLKNLNINKPHFILAIIISIFICALSAAIGTAGIVLSGNTWQAAFIGTGIGWFLGDTVSAFLGIYALVYFTKRASEMGLVIKYWN